jgi:hypothetical protein
MFQFPKNPTIVRGKAPEAYLYAPDKKDKKVTDKDLFIMTKTRDVKKKSK